MAPSLNFFSKLVKVASPTSRERRSSETSSPRTSEVVPRRSRSSSKSQAKATSPTTPTQANVLTSTVIKGTQNSTSINKATSFESVGTTTSTQPNVTVVPPSPLTHSEEIFESDDDDLNEKPSITAVSTLVLTTTSPPSNKKLPSMPSSAPFPTSTPTSTPASPQKLTNGRSNSAMASTASLLPSTLQVRKKSSTQSMKSVKKVPSELNLTAPADTDPDSITRTGIIDSPPDINSPLPALVASPNGGSTINLSVQRQNTDTASISSKKSNRPWRRSTSRKPSGLAGAIAASGLAMANPVLSPTHQAQISPPSIITSPQQSVSSATSKKSSGSAPYMSISPAQSSTSQRTRRSVELSPKLLRPKKSMTGTSAKSSKQRKSSVSVNSDNGSEYYAAGGDEVRAEYYSGLEGSSADEGSGSDLDSEDLELGDDDIPVTGFAVASNKRNADFHELFPTIPEGDYLIEGGRSIFYLSESFFS